MPQISTYMNELNLLGDCGNSGIENTKKNTKKYKSGILQKIGSGDRKEYKKMTTAWKFIIPTIGYYNKL